MKIIYSILGVLFGVLLVMRISSTPQSCLVSEAGDSESFANASAINDKYLAVGDPEANRVVIYTRDAKGKWLRSKEILPPKGSEAQAVGFGFGYDVSLDESTLVIGAFASKRKPKNPEAFRSNDSLRIWSSSGGVYKTTLDKEIEVERIDLVSKGGIPRGLVSADGGKIAYNTELVEKDERYKVYLHENGNIKNVFVSPADIKDVDRTAFGASIALKNNLLLVGSPWNNPKGVAWLFDLKAPEAKPRRLAIPEESVGHSVAVSERFAAASSYTQNSIRGQNNTLVTAIEEGSTTVIDGVGKLSLDGNILAIMRPIPPSFGIYFGSKQQSLLRLFDLTKVTTPRLIIKRGGIDDAYVQNNFLTTIQKFHSRTKTKICIEQVIK